MQVINDRTHRLFLYFLSSGDRLKVFFIIYELSTIDNVVTTIANLYTVRISQLLNNNTNPVERLLHK